MDIKEYITSGILEHYVLGTASKQEQQEVECMSHIYPEIGSELAELQLNIEALAQAAAVTPPIEVKQRVMKLIKETKQVGNKEPKVVSLTKPATPLLIQRWMVAASIVLLIGLSSMYWSSQGNLKQLEDQYARLQQKSSELSITFLEQSKQLEEKSVLIGQKEKIAVALANKNTARVELEGTESSPNSSVTVYWNKESKEVLMQLAVLPELEDKKQYQLWAIVDGKPTDMGVFDLEKAKSEIQIMPYRVENAVAFAITVEPEGGSVNPTLSSMVVVGNV